MIAWMVTTITLILLFFVIWRMTSRSFRERCERPKYLFLESLGVSVRNPSKSAQSPSFSGEYR